MKDRLKLPIGIEDFRKIRQEGFYYVDKTGLIEELLVDWGEVNLFTRPRRFGKSLNISMLKNFFEIGMDSALFNFSARKLGFLKPEMNVVNLLHKVKKYDIITL